MNIYLLSFIIAAFITSSGCQRIVQTGNIANTKIDSTTNTKIEVDTFAKIESTSKAENFTLSIEPKIFDNSTIGKARLVVTNNTNEKILTGLAYYVDLYEHNAWKRLNLHEDIIFESVGVDINPFSARELEVNLKILPYHYKPGKYRITKDIITVTKKQVLVSTEFTVE